MHRRIGPRSRHSFYASEHRQRFTTTDTSTPTSLPSWERSGMVMEPLLDMDSPCRTWMIPVLVMRKGWDRTWTMGSCKWRAISHAWLIKDRRGFHLGEFLFLHICFPVLTLIPPHNRSHKTLLSPSLSLRRSSMSTLPPRAHQLISQPIIGDGISGGNTIPWEISWIVYRLWSAWIV
jgi:hypothetical protein